MESNRLKTLIHINEQVRVGRLSQGCLQYIQTSVHLGDRTQWLSAGGTEQTSPCTYVGVVTHVFNEDIHYIALQRVRKELWDLTMDCSRMWSTMSRSTLEGWGGILRKALPAGMEIRLPGNVL